MGNRVRIIADHREVPSGIVRALQSDPDVELVVEQMELGDFCIGEGTFVERKSAMDFTNSIIDRRLFTQISRAKDIGARMIYLLEGNPFGVGRIEDNAISGALAYLTVIEGFSVLPSPSAGFTAAQIKRMAEQQQHGLGYEVQLRPPVPKTLEQQQSYVLTGLPGIGDGKAADLLAHFGTPQAVFSATDDELLEVRGMGKAGVAKIRRVLSGK